MNTLEYAESLLADAMQELRDTARRLGLSDEEIEIMLKEEFYEPLPR